MKNASSQITRSAELLAVAAVALSACGLVGTIDAADQPAPAQSSPPAFDGGKSTWHDDFVRYDFLMDKETFEITPFTRPDNERFGVGTPPAAELRCIVVAPKNPASGNPWSWQACHWDHRRQAEVELLRRGFHIAFITPDPGKQWDAWYAFLTEKHRRSFAARQGRRVDPARLRQPRSMARPRDARGGEEVQGTGRKFHGDHQGGPGSLCGRFAGSEASGGFRRGQDAVNSGAAQQPVPVDESLAGSARRHPRGCKNRACAIPTRQAQRRMPHLCDGGRSEVHR